MRFTDYQAQAVKTVEYPKEARLQYVVLGLVGEAGEVANKVKKIFRDDKGIVTENRRKAIAKELGDVLWYLASTCTELNLELDDVAKANIAKLMTRKEEGSIEGEGDDRELEK